MRILQANFRKTLRLQEMQSRRILWEGLPETRLETWAQTNVQGRVHFNDIEIPRLYARRNYGSRPSAIAWRGLVCLHEKV